MCVLVFPSQKFCSDFSHIHRHWRAHKVDRKIHFKANNSAKSLPLNVFKSYFKQTKPTHIHTQKLIGQRERGSVPIVCKPKTRRNVSNWNERFCNFIFIWNGFLPISKMYLEIWRCVTVLKPNHGLILKLYINGLLVLLKCWNEIFQYFF